MKAQDLLELAARNLREAKLRNSLTTLGIGVGVASLVAMLALGVGLQEMASSRLARSGLFDTVFVFSRPEFRGFDRGERRAGDPSQPRDLRPLDEAARKEIEKLPNVLDVFPEIRFTCEVRYADKSQFTFVSGLAPSAKKDEAFENMKGRFFSSPESEEAILQLQFAKAIEEKEPEKLIGQELMFRYAVRKPSDGGTGFSVERAEKKVRIVGIIEREPFGGVQGFGRGRVFVPIGLADKLDTVNPINLRDLMRTETSVKTYQALQVKMSNPNHVQAAEDAIKKLGFSTFSLLQATRNLRRFFAVLDLFLGIFGSVALAVASLGIINTLVMSVLERRREIGIMKALGASDGDVKRLFFTEAAAMGFLGGVLGVLIGWGIGTAVNFGTGIYLKRQELPPETIWSLPWWLVLAAIAFSMVVSLISGLYPAARAAKLDPVQALRYE